MISIRQRQGKRTGFADKAFRSNVQNIGLEIFALGRGQFYNVQASKEDIHEHQNQQSGQFEFWRKVIIEEGRRQPKPYSDWFEKIKTTN